MFVLGRIILLYALHYNMKAGFIMQVLVEPKDHNDTLDLVKASESTLVFWDNEEDAVWDNVSY